MAATLRLSSSQARELDGRILATIATGPHTARALTHVVGVRYKVLGNHLTRLKRQGAIRRLGGRAAAWWAASDYGGAIPAGRRSPTTHRPGRMIAPRVEVAPETSWWIQGTRDAFRDAAVARAHQQGWICRQIDWGQHAS